jgi:SAM-dependent methyltransferase
MHFVVMIFLLMVGLAGSATAASDPLRVELPVSPDLSHYAYLLEAPSYAALALQNAGLNLSLTKPLVVSDRETFGIGPGKVKYVGRKADVYRYAVTLTLPLGKDLAFPVEVDASTLIRGRLAIRLYLPLGALVPQELIDKVESKLQALTNANAQTQLLAYLAERSPSREGAAEARAELFDVIAFDAYNQAGHNVTKDVGGSEPVSDQLVLLASIVIWAICFPVFLYAVRRQRAALACGGREAEVGSEEYSRYLLKRSALGKLYREHWLYPRLCRSMKGRTLDIGCGIGDMLAFRADTVGVDINEHNVGHCKQRGLDARVMQVDKLPFGAAAFDSVLLDNVLEHISDPSPLLAEVRRVLRADGRVVVGVPGRYGQSWDSDHKVFYDESRLQSLAEQHGFRVVRFIHMPLWKSGLLSRRLRQYCVYAQWVLAGEAPPVH